LSSSLASPKRRSIARSSPSWIARAFGRTRRLFTRRRRVPIWYAAAYRLPLPSLESQSGIEPRRADLALWYLLQHRLTRSRDVHTPPRADYDLLGLAHDAAYLETLSHADTLARIFAVSPAEIVVEEVMHTVRLAVGGTVAAARAAWDSRGPAFNLLGGFHHAGPAMGGGLCPVNDVAIAIAAVRKDGMDGQIVILDLDAHPPDGLSACVLDLPRVHLASISGSDFGPLPGAVDEVFLADADDARYLDALSALLARAPRPDLAFVLAGGDVLAGDRLGKLRLTLAGVRDRDLMVADWLTGVASVWLPAGGYSDDTWKVLVGTYLAVSRRSARRVDDRDPMTGRFAAIAGSLNAKKLSGDVVDDWSLADVEAELYGRATPRPRLLGYYTTEGLEYALTRYGLLDHLRRLGYQDLVIQIDAPDQVGQRVTVQGNADGRTHLLIDLILGRDSVAGEPSLMVHWLSLRNPRVAFARGRKPLPGQEVPGLGLARDMGQLLGLIAQRLGLVVVAFRPAYLHPAYAARTHFRFADADRQDRFLGLLHDLRGHPMAEVSRALSDGRVLLDGNPYAWEPDVMIYRPSDPLPSLARDPGPQRFSIRE
jgi:acetoin utilization deacetylase AcuC-like enzyme